MSLETRDAFDDGSPIPLPDCGQRVSVESLRHEEKLWTHMIGFKPGSYLVLEKPPGTDAIDGKRQLRDGDSLVIRFLKDGCIYGFRTPVLCTATVPYRLLFVGYPAEVAEHSLRSSPRLECYLPCEGQIGGRAFSRAFIRDFSATGCQLRIPLDALEPEEDAEDGDSGLPGSEAQGFRSFAGMVAQPSEPSASAAGDLEGAAGAPAADDAYGEGDEAADDAEDGEADAIGENRLSLVLQLPGEDDIRVAQGDVIDWQTLPRFHQVRVRFDEPQLEIFEQLSLYTTRLG